MTVPGGGVPGSGPADPDAIMAEIEATRDHLGRTVEELSHRLDVPARARESAKESAARAKDTAVETYRENPPLVIAAGVAVVALVVGIVVWRNKRAKRSKR